MKASSNLQLEGISELVSLCSGEKKSTVSCVQHVALSKGLRVSHLCLHNLFQVLEDTAAFVAAEGKALGASALANFLTALGHSAVLRVTQPERAVLNSKQAGSALRHLRHEFVVVDVKGECTCPQAAWPLIVAL